MVSIVIPVIRPKKAQRAISSAIVNAGMDHLEILSEVDEDRIGAPKMVKRLVEKSKYDLVAFIGDDTIPQKDWLKNAVEAMDMLPDGWGLIGLNDTTGRTLATHWLASKKLLPLIGGEFFHTGYYHCFCDNELQERCMKLNKYAYAKNAVVLHDHPILKRKPITGEYLRIYSKKWVDHDQTLFMKRRELWNGNDA